MGGVVSVERITTKIYFIRNIKVVWFLTTENNIKRGIG